MTSANSVNNFSKHTHSLVKPTDLNIKKLCTWWAKSEWRAYLNISELITPGVNQQEGVLNASNLHVWLGSAARLQQLERNRRKSVNTVTMRTTTTATSTMAPPPINSAPPMQCTTNAAVTFSVTSAANPDYQVSVYIVLTNHMLFLLLVGRMLIWIPNNCTPIKLRFNYSYMFIK